MRRVEGGEVSMEITEDEQRTIAALIQDWGFEYSLKADRKKVLALAERLGLHEWVRNNK